MIRSICLVTTLILIVSGPDTARAEGPKELVIVAPERFHSALEAFVTHKKALLPTKLVALEAVLRDSPGVDDPERLKMYLYAAWRERHAGYALLVGDADVLPVRYMVLDRVTPQAFDYAFYPSDLYYSDLADAKGRFDDWNACKDGFHAAYFGEVRGEKNKDDPINFDAIDYRPDLAIGRWPVSSEEEVRIVAEKTIAYEKHVLANDAPGARRVAFFAVGGWVDSRPLMGRLASGLPSGWTAERRFYGSRRSSPPPDGEQLVNLMNEGVGLVLHAGHGTDDGWEQCTRLDDLLPKLKNGDRLPIVLSAGCSTARFATLPPYEAYVDVEGREHRGTNEGEVFKTPPPPPKPYQTGRFNGTGLGEGLLRRGPTGAVAYIGCNTGSQPCGLTLMEGFVRALNGRDELRLGDCWAAAVNHYHTSERLATLKPDNDWYPPSIFFQGMKFMLFGDPSLRLPAPGPTGR